MYQIEFSKEISPSWLKADRLQLPELIGLQQNVAVASADVLATCQVDGQTVPLMVRQGTEVQALFDVEQTCANILKEQYEGAALNHGIFAHLPFDYNQFPTWFIGLVSNLMNKPIDIEQLPNFPKYPLDCSIDALRTMLRGEEQQPWGKGKQYAVCFTHDVDTDWVFRNQAWLTKFRAAEEDNNVRAAWYIVPKAIKSQQTKQQIAALVAAGHEIGAHGYTHSPGLPLLSEAKLTEYLRKSHDIVRALSDDKIGYRAPWLARNANLFQVLHQVGFAYDSSVPNADYSGNNAASNNGCCTVFPYRRNGIPVLPLTIPLDGVARALQKSPIEFYDWVLGLRDQIKAVGGVMVVTTHTTPHFSANDPMLEGYRYLIEQLVADEEAWIALPRTIVETYAERVWR